ncbi:tyrosine decarboxylase-like [Spinacia oleracea]|uniref:Tyrosine decarboxylase-like n=1 Tax=Spinacia oleracea TaxID=3562 RepID=A0A9R0IZT6_SPIOL|nr:tyrosine decarboxylase-like [Spinacia oleracea]XP_056697069.1 tyrosine decarboxylase-like [Spinacia oleracea]
MGSLDIKSLESSTPMMNMNNNPLDPEEFRKQGYMVIDFLAEYYKSIEKYPVRSQVEAGYLRKKLPVSAPNDPVSMETILADIQTDIVPGLTHWQSPNYFAYFPSSGSTAGLLGETLASGFNVVGFNWISSPASTELESIVMDWLAEMLSLPKSFTFSGGGGGVMMGTTCEAILTTITAARDGLLDKIGRHNINKLVVYGSDQTHCSFFKSAKIAGISPANFRTIKTTKANAFSLRGDSLRATIEADVNAGLIPLFLVATVGTTSTAAVDAVGPLCDVAKEYNMWVHVDAAYAGNGCICPELRHMIDGVEKADSFSFNAHKWFLTTLDCCCLFVKDPNALVRCLSTNPEYLKNKATDTNQVVDYKDWQLTLSRRFRSLKMWMVIRSYGVDFLRNFLRSHVGMAIYFEKMVVKDTRFEIVVPRSFALVCFRLSGSAVLECSGQKFLEEETLNEINTELLESVNSDGKIYMTHSLVDGIFMIRFAVGATLTEIHHVTYAWKVVQEHATALLARLSMIAC